MSKVKWNKIGVKQLASN